MRTLIILTLIIILTSCKSKESEQAISLHTQNLPSDFLDFYQRFHNDSLFQMEHIIFPLQEKKENEYWASDDWLLHRPFDNSTDEFVRTFTNLNSIIFEIIVSKDKTYSMERRFSKSGNSYNLIYYKVTNAFENSDFEQIIE